VLGHRHDMLRLDAAYHCRAYQARQQWIFAKRVICAPVRKVAIDVDERLQRDVDAERTCFPSDHHSVQLRQLDIKAGGHAHRRRLPDGMHWIMPRNQ